MFRRYAAARHGKIKTRQMAPDDDTADVHEQAARVVRSDQGRWNCSPMRSSAFARRSRN
jgi:hypothetical protein